MDRLFDIGDRVICKESGVVGEVIKFYTPTASEEQTMVRTDSWREYHAPTRTWVKESKTNIVVRPGFTSDELLRGMLELKNYGMMLK
jgi:hypothetical protein